MMNTSYDVLGVPRNASNETIRAAFRRAAKSCHPDLNAGDPTAEPQFRQVIAAYEVLRNPEQRASYDQYLAAYEQHLRNRRRKRIQRFAAPPLAALVSGGIVAVGVWLSSGPHTTGSAGATVAQTASQQVVAAVDESDSPRPTGGYPEAQTPSAREWERVGANGDPMAIWAFAIRNPDAPESELARSKLVELIDTTEDVFALQVLRIGAADAIAERAQQRLARLGALAVAEEDRVAAPSSTSAAPTSESAAPSSESAAASSKSLEERAASFVSERISEWSSADATDLPSLASAYAEEVFYYGSRRSRQAVLLDKRRFLERWPERLYEVQPDSITVQCVANTCKVSGLIDWRARSASRGTSASGLAQFEYNLVPSGDTFNIRSESSLVVKPLRTGARR